jgi:hypothetical protein
MEFFCRLVNLTSDIGLNNSTPQTGVMQMATLKSLTFAAFTPPKVMNNSNPTEKRRAKVIARLEDQKRLLADPDFTRTVKKWKKNGDGQKTLVERKQRVLPSWFEVDGGKYVFLVKSGWQSLEFAKGKSAIAVPSLSKLPGIIETVIEAVRNGELDEQLASASVETRKKLKKKAA